MYQNTAILAAFLLIYSAVAGRVGDAANADFDVVRRNIGIAARLLLIGLPLTIVLGFLVPHGSASRDRSARNGAAR